MISRLSSVLVIAFLLSSLPIFGQTEIIVYDGYTGIYNVSIQNDTARIATLLPGSPAEKAGIKYRDQIIAINDSAISGKGLKQRIIQDLLRNKSGEAINLTIKRKNADSLLHFSFFRDPYFHEIVAFEFEYLIDSLEQWDISHILSGSLDSLFTNPLMAKSTVYSVEEGSPAAKIGILPGDQVISLLEELDKDALYHISSGIFSNATVDTFFTILREDSLIHYDLEPSVSTSLNGIKSQFDHDFHTPCAWLKIKTVNRISENRNYLINLP
ncbi:MAG: PDZ domain-containing protein, partial [Bacteroidales bacterium]|nr:PDZ domain-containing protein [Bacteroidales bacterium]